ncbi:MAG TPA: hypothetical protein VE954_43295 [Oligoflexus sp.]|uniref:hypothetical protein n=1 Tax=Oligoflexus sp. TaxID=1971216 RepID=UPI002D70F3C0|nr:hypothetical protein [Oligoflexus sp.]HYX39971.1 hypothetical protein [Oligoflexus sp.]
MNRDEGLQEIDEAQWEKDDYKTLNLYVHTRDDRKVHAWMLLRPPYCDRGHIQLCIDGPLNLDGHDSFPRYFFSFEEADTHCRTFLKWRLWQHRTHNPAIDDLQRETP